MGRLRGWEAAGFAALAAARRTPFAWGGHDCWRAPCAVAAAVAGVDPAAWFDGKYDTPGRALAAGRRFLGVKKSAAPADLIAAVAEKAFAAAGFAPIRAAEAGRFDLVLFSGLPHIDVCTLGAGKSAVSHFGSTVGVVTGRRATVFAIGGPVEVPTLAAVRAWKI